jgi:hypothetical protein
MEFMLIFLSDRDAPEDDSVYEEMGGFAGELARKGKLRGGAPLHPEEEGARVRAKRGKPVVTDGPFTETKEVIGGFFMVECKSLEEAIELAKKCPHHRVGTVEVRQVIPMGGGDEEDGEE